MPRWQLLFILPNLSLRTKGPFASEYVCICSAEDERMNHLTDSPADQTAVRMVGAFRNWFGVRYMPSCLLLRERSDEVLRAFRNVCAISTITQATARMFNGGQWLPTYGDFFFFASHVPNQNGWIGNLQGMVRGMNDDVDSFAGQCAGHRSTGLRHLPSIPTRSFSDYC
jgi:hypothetical protein